MTIDQTARAAIAYFSNADAITMTAIAGAESGFNPAAAGDPLSIFPPALQTKWSQYASHGHLSFGLWQIFLGVHTPLIQQLSGSTEPDQLASWLQNPLNNARAAAHVFAGQGFDAWSAYLNGTTGPFINDARAAVAAAIAATPPPDSKSIVAISIAPPSLHVDYYDGSFSETAILDIQIYSPWLRFNIAPFPPQQPILMPFEPASDTLLQDLTP